MSLIDLEGRATSAGALEAAALIERCEVEQGRWSRHWYGDDFDPRCPRCRERGAACDEAKRRAVEA